MNSLKPTKVLFHHVVEGYEVSKSFSKSRSSHFYLMQNAMSFPIVATSNSPMSTKPVDISAIATTPIPVEPLASFTGITTGVEFPMAENEKTYLLIS